MGTNINFIKNLGNFGKTTNIKIPSEKCVALGHLIFDSLDKARDELGWR